MRYQGSHVVSQHRVLKRLSKMESSISYLCSYSINISRDKQSLVGDFSDHHLFILYFSLFTQPHLSQSPHKMAHENRIHQLEDIANKTLHDRYGALAKGELSSSSSDENGLQQQQQHLVPVPVTLKAQLGSPVRLISSFSRFSNCSAYGLILKDRRRLRSVPFRRRSRRWRCR